MQVKGRQEVFRVGGVKCPVIHCSNNATPRLPIEMRLSSPCSSQTIRTSVGSSVFNDAVSERTSALHATRILARCIGDLPHERWETRHSVPEQDIGVSLDGATTSDSAFQTRRQHHPEYPLGFAERSKTKVHAEIALLELTPKFLQSRIENEISRMELHRDGSRRRAVD